VHHAAPGHHDPVKSSRFKTGVALLAGCLTLAWAFGMTLGQPGIGTVIGAGVWLVTVSAIRVARGL
jgi:hypothetical protein